MKELTDLPNIGKVLAGKLKMAGINTKQELIETGAENAIIKISTIDGSTCIDMLYAIEGAIKGIRWHCLSQERKQELNTFFQMLRKKS